MNKRRSRVWINWSITVFIAMGLLWAFWPRPLSVDIGEAKYEAMTVKISEEGKTRVHDAYIISAPVTGRLLRIEVEEGDAVEGGKSVIAQMLPANPEALDVRTREQARNAVVGAEAALKIAQAALNKAIADKDYADEDIKRKRALIKKKTISQATLDRAEQAWHTANIALERAKAQISMSQADLSKARAVLVEFKPGSAPSQETLSDEIIPIVAPISGRILRIMEENATTVPVGKPLIEVGNISNDLEIVAELLSSDAVQVSKGDKVIIKNWGGEYPLHGTVMRVEPSGFTKFSALGIEEQRVNTIIKFDDSPEKRKSLGNGYRVELEIIIWENEKTLIVPSNALFRENDDWAVYTVKGGSAQLKILKIGQNNGTQAEVLEGLESGEKIILYPGAGISDGTRVRKRD